MRQGWTIGEIVRAAGVCKLVKEIEAEAVKDSMP